MAQAGFPWHAQSRHESSEKDRGLGVPQSRPTPALNGTTNLKPSTISICDNKPKANGSTKKRSDSVYTNPAAKQNLRVQSEPPRQRPAAQRIPVRTIPAWVQDADEDDLIEAGLLLPDSPNNALVAQHNHTPASRRPLLHSQLQPPASDGYPTSSGGRRSEPTSRWISFARSSAYPRERFDYEKVDPEWLNENFTDYSKPWLADHNDDDVEDGSDKYRAFRRKRRSWYKRISFAVMRNPFVPLVFRLVVLIFAIIAMALGASIHHKNNVVGDCMAQPQNQRDAFCATLIGQGDVDYDRDPSAMMAIIVDAVAIVYTVYITYDEYFSKPLGLRPPSAKVRLVLLDLIFIVFQSANLSLAFNSLTVDQGPCKSGDIGGSFFRFGHICHRAKALGSVLIVSLLAWLLTFSISILRYVLY
ncbi:hypothetical protein LTR70_000284 [Exophiala xenobiotica]|uniref:Regulator of phospholipase D SRF1 n=1 Tax=Lithohypha guttulata TaxID=1690604 RepID=A0ABR0K6L7_9EURO|nr:hypothetical protein LTR24_006741 [Lithohypha guttulata]KAK5330962.1 hypothetical protein LTR70_000284 [Exophiala xenobiotica]